MPAPPPAMFSFRNLWRRLELSFISVPHKGLEARIKQQQQTRAAALRWYILRVCAVAAARGPRLQRNTFLQDKQAVQSDSGTNLSHIVRRPGQFYNLYHFSTQDAETKAPLGPPVFRAPLDQGSGEGIRYTCQEAILSWGGAHKIPEPHLLWIWVAAQGQIGNHFLV